MIIGYYDTVVEWQKCHSDTFVTKSEHFTIFIDHKLDTKTDTIRGLLQYRIVTISYYHSTLSTEIICKVQPKCV